MDLLHLRPVIFRVDGGYGTAVGELGFVSLSSSIIDEGVMGVSDDGRWRSGGSVSVLGGKDCQ